jgi:hypothetical protein
MHGQIPVRFNDLNELAPNDLPLLLRVGNTVQKFQERSACIDALQIDALPNMNHITSRLHTNVLHLLTTLVPQPLNHL